MYSVLLLSYCKRLGKWGFVASLITASPGSATFLRLSETTSQVRSCTVSFLTSTVRSLAFFFPRHTLALH
jgi:hypothetical protein